MQAGRQTNRQMGRWTDRWTKHSEMGGHDEGHKGSSHSILDQPGPGWDNKESDSNGEIELGGMVCTWDRCGCGRKISSQIKK